MLCSLATRSLRLTGAALLGAALAGCWAGDGLVTGGLGGSSSRTESSGLGRSPTLLVATTRRPTDGGQRPWFGRERGEGLTFAEARLKAPEASLSGRIASVVGGDWTIAGVEGLRNEGAAAAFAQGAMGRDVLLYVHGYKETFETAATNAAQLSSGIGFKGATGLFTWPSAASTF